MSHQGHRAELRLQFLGMDFSAGTRTNVPLNQCCNMSCGEELHKHHNSAAREPRLPDLFITLIKYTAIFQTSPFSLAAKSNRPHGCPFAGRHLLLLR